MKTFDKADPPSIPLRAAVFGKEEDPALYPKIPNARENAIFLERILAYTGLYDYDPRYLELRRRSAVALGHLGQTNSIPAFSKALDFISSYKLAAKHYGSDRLDAFLESLADGLMRIGGPQAQAELQSWG